MFRVFLRKPDVKMIGLIAGPGETESAIAEWTAGAMCETQALITAGGAIEYCIERGAHEIAVRGVRKWPDFTISIPGGVFQQNIF